MIQVTIKCGDRSRTLAKVWLSTLGPTIFSQFGTRTVQSLPMSLEELSKTPCNRNLNPWLHARFMFSRMRSKGSRFTLGVWGLRVCSLDVAFASATVRNRPREDRMAVPMVSSAGGVIFGGFQRFVASFRVAGVALCDIQTCSVTRRKSFCVAGAILLRRFQEMRGSFR